MGNAHSLLTYVPVSELQLTEAKLCHPPAQLWAWQAFGRIRLMAPPTALLCSVMPMCPPLFFRNVTTKFRFCCKRIPAVLPGGCKRRCKLPVFQKARRGRLENPFFPVFLGVCLGCGATMCRRGGSAAALPPMRLTGLRFSVMIKMKADFA